MADRQSAFTRRMVAASTAAQAAWGREAQLRMVAEECIELALDVLHEVRGREVNPNDVLGEVADVYVVLRHLRVAFAFTDEQVRLEIEKKVGRLESRIRDADRRKDNAAIAAMHEGLDGRPYSG